MTPEQTSEYLKRWIPLLERYGWPVIGDCQLVYENDIWSLLSRPNNPPQYTQSPLPMIIYTSINDVAALSLITMVMLEKLYTKMPTYCLAWDEYHACIDDEWLNKEGYGVTTPKECKTIHEAVLEAWEQIAKDEAAQQ